MNASPRALALLSLLLSLATLTGAAQPIAARHKQGSSHGYLLLRSPDGHVIGAGDLVTRTRGTQVRSHLVFHFRDGSVDDEVTVFNQGEVLQLVSDHHIQRGPSFPKPIDLAVDARTGEVTTREETDGQLKVQTRHMDLPEDLANGFIGPILENVLAASPETKVTYLAATPKPRIVTMSIKPAGRDTYKIGGFRHHAIRYILHIDLGGIDGVIAPLLGKEPSDTTIWVDDGEVPSFLKMQGALYQGGPIWTTELTSPTWNLASR